ncbi:ParB/RepB/Spo0J family partition protein [Bdellovibrio sp. HCB337]|uniref:ParB/RepB/Spo0J family partition protein n=1 Tax=Bdellovibrio sp. HCB337 TaxID=3394358 RepID=UPI0039A59FC8
MSDLNAESSNKKKGLGRGLGSLLGGGPAAEGMASKTMADGLDTHASNQTKPAQNFAGASAKPAPAAQTSAPAAAAPVAAAPINTEGKVWQVAIDKLASGQYQPRKSFEKEALQSLAQSIKENGILQPIIARKVAGGRLEIVAGERRWRAAQAAGLHEVPVLIKNFDDQETLELAIIENIQREDLNPIEEAEGYSRLITEFKMSQQQVADKVGRDRATVANSVRLLALPAEAKKLVSEGTLSVGHAKVLLSLTDAKKQLELAKKVINDRLSVRKLEKLVADAQNPSSSLEPESAIEQNVTQRLISGLCDELQKILGTKVNIDYANSKGKIAVHFYSDDELTQIVDRLKEGWQK